MVAILDHGRFADFCIPAAAPRRGLHGQRLGSSDGTERRTPLRFVLPAGALA
jgi:hypothetical protein